MTDVPFRIESSGCIATVRFGRPATFEDLLAASEAVEREPDPVPLRCWDLSRGICDLSTAQVRLLALESRRHSDSSRSAVVAPDDLAFGLSRMIAAYRGDGPGESGVFRSEAEARAWLERSGVERSPGR